MRYISTSERLAHEGTLRVDFFVRRIYRIEVCHEDGESEPMCFKRQERTP